MSELSNRVGYTGNMVTVLTGDDGFAVSDYISGRLSVFEGAVDRVDGENIQLRDIPDLLMGQSLFGDKRLVIISNLSKNSSVWPKIPGWLPKISSDIELILVEDKLDKRTVTYKELKATAEIKEFTAWSDRDERLAAQWLVTRSGASGINLDHKVASRVVSRVGVDKWRLANSLEILAGYEGDIAEAVVDDLLVASVSASVFDLFDSALSGNISKIGSIIKDLQLREDAYSVFALIASQTFQLLAVSRSQDGDSPEKDLAIHPFVASKLRHASKRLGRQKVELIAANVAKNDAKIKSTSVDPWVLVEKTLLDIAS